MANAAKATSYKQAKLSENWDAIVIGSGIGGLTAAALLSIHGGKRVLVLERHYVAGGFTHSFHRPGYEWDVGLHYVGQVQDPDSNVRKTFDHVTKSGVRWSAMPEVYDRAIIEGRQFDFVAGEGRLRESLKQSFPNESRAIDKYFAAIRSASRFAMLYYAEKAIPGAAAAVAGALLRAPYMRWARRTTLEVFQDFTTNRELMGVLAAQWGDYGLPPSKSSFAIHATIAGHYFEGGSYPVGGASTIAAAIIPQIEQSGGVIITSAEVTQILCSGNQAVGVRMADGREFRAGQVISDAGAANTFCRLLPEDTISVHPLRSELQSLPASTAHLSLYLGLNGTAAELGFEGTNLWIYPGYDHDKNVERFSADPDSPFPMIYISFPSAKDPEFNLRHPGKSTIEAITMLPYDSFARWQNSRWKKRGAHYDGLKEQFTSRLLAELERHVPQTAGRVDHAELSTPVTTRHFMNYEKGEIYGIAATPSRYRLRALGARTPMRNLYLTGQDVASLGVVGALYGGVISASVALGKNLISAVAKPLPCT
jgi:all-trans-retinol 13,14-reductase